MSNKNEQRKAVKQMRLDIKKELYQAYSDTICLKIMNLDLYENASVVMAYCPVNKEVDTSLLLEECITDKKLALPKTDTKTKKISPRLVNSLSDLEEGSYLIMEPKKKCSEIPIEKVDIVVVPIVAFDKKGTRLGYGGGYYDRLLKDMPHCKKIGIAFSLQQLEHVQKEEHDINLDMIITEKKIFKF